MAGNRSLQFLFTDLHNARATFEQARFKLVTTLPNVEGKKRLEFLEAVSGTMDAHLRYFKQVKSYCCVMLHCVFVSSISESFICLYPVGYQPRNVILLPETKQQTIWFLHQLKGIVLKLVMDRRWNKAANHLVLASAQRNSSKVGHGLLTRCIWIILPKKLYFAGGEYPRSNGLDREDNRGYCFIAEFAVSEWDCSSSNKASSRKNWLRLGMKKASPNPDFTISFLKPGLAAQLEQLLAENKSITTQDFHGSGVNTICTTDSHQLDLDKLQ
nr:ADP-ribosylation factor GTPase-activating protein AGD3 [Tanacetum cinerariifolium]